MDRQELGIGKLIEILILAATALKGDGVDLEVDPTRNTGQVPSQISKSYLVATAMGEHYGDGQGEKAYMGQSILPPPEGREGYQGKEDSHGPWQINMLTWAKDPEDTNETLKNAPRFKGLSTDEIRTRISTNPEDSAYAYLYIINLPRYINQLGKYSEEMEDKVVLDRFDAVYKDWSSSSGGRGKFFLTRDKTDFAGDRGLEPVEEIEVETPETPDTPVQPPVVTEQQEPQAPNRMFPTKGQYYQMNDKEQSRVDMLPDGILDRVVKLFQKMTDAKRQASGLSKLSDIEGID